ncbi:MAG: phage tail assembly protein [Spirochaetales bacterium]|nr:phage tail assembly protein [Spirochaetales bacterium]
MSSTEIDRGPGGPAPDAAGGVNGDHRDAAYESADEVVDGAVAEQWLSSMEREWGLLAAGQRPIVLQAIRKGWVDYDAGEGTLLYRLQRPFTLDNGASFDTVVLREPTAADLRKIGRNMFVSRGRGDDTQVELAQATELTLRVITVLDTRWPLGIAERIYRRDMRVLGALTGFFA